jgi:aspartate kinase
MEKISPRSVVMKFGGSSVEDTSAFKRVSRIVQSSAGRRPVVVVSAMLSATDALLTAVQLAVIGKSDDAFDVIESQLYRSASVAQQLLGADHLLEFDKRLDKSRHDIAAILQSFSGRAEEHPLFQDVIVSYGERLSAKLLAYVLSEDGLDACYVDARRLIVTNDDHGRAEPFHERTYRNTARELQPLLDAGQIPVLGGFIGAHVGGATTTLGRNGSDYTASLVGAALCAQEIEIWTDVNGILSADPRVVSTAATVSHFSYDEAAALSYFGAKVLHPKTVRPAAEKLIPIRILNSRSPEEPGTLVSSESGSAASSVKTITCKTGISVLTLTNESSLKHTELLAGVFEILRLHEAEVILSSASESRITLVLEDDSIRPTLLSALEMLGRFQLVQNKSLIAFVGNRLNVAPHILARVVDCLAGFEVSLISDGGSETHFSLITDQSNALTIITRLHDELFESDGRAPYSHVPLIGQIAS